MKDLTTCRKELDLIDAQLVHLFEQRMQVARDVAAYKQANHLPILDAAREQEVLVSRASRVQDGSLRESAEAFFCAVMELSREEQRRYIANHAPFETDGV